MMLTFLKGENTILDLSNEPYYKMSNSEVAKGKEMKPWETIKHHEPQMTLNEARNEFRRMMSTTYFDEVFGVFPLIALVKGHPLNVSVDQVEAGVQESGYQLVNTMLNLAKCTLSNEELREEFKVRGFLQHKQRVIMPVGYENNSVFVHRISGKVFKNGLTANKGNPMSETQKRKLSSVKRDRPNIKGRKMIPLLAYPKNSYGPPNRYSNSFEAVQILGLGKCGSANIRSTLTERIKSAYGFVWKYSPF